LKASQSTARADPQTDRQAAEERYRLYLDSLLTGEKVDPDWAAAAKLESRLRVALPAGSRVEAIDCRTTLCRVTTSHASLDEYHSFISAAFEFKGAKRVWQEASIFMLLEPPTNSTGHVRAAMYLGRGEVLPSLPKDPPAP
jgi:hypothetical protein